VNRSDWRFLLWASLAAVVVFLAVAAVVDHALAPCSPGRGVACEVTP
jgi:hypothetical protein